MRYKGKTSRRVRCASGVFGTRSRLQARYDNFLQFQEYSNMYGIHLKLGYKNSATAWRENPIIESSVVASDLRKVS